MPIADASNFVFFQLINDYLRDEINTFQWNLLTSTAQFIGAIGLMLLSVWIALQGFRIVTGRSRQPMMALVGDSLRAVLILGIATGAAGVSSNLYWALTDGTASAITALVSHHADSPYANIDKNLAHMQGMFSAIDSLASGGDPSVDSAKSRAMWFSGIGIAGPGVIGGSLLLLSKIALALFVGFGPLFVLCLLFEKTKALFEKWLLYGIGTVFSLAVLSFMVGLANNIVQAVAISFLARFGVLLADTASLEGASTVGEGITSLAMQQGGIGLVLTTLVVSAPPMAAAFFRGVLGQFQVFSAFGMIGRGMGAGGYASESWRATAAANATGYGSADRSTIGESERRTVTGRLHQGVPRDSNAALDYIKKREWSGMRDTAEPGLLQDLSGDRASELLSDLRLQQGDVAPSVLIAENGRDSGLATAVALADRARTGPVFQDAAKTFGAKAVAAYNAGNAAEGDRFLNYAASYSTESANAFSAAKALDAAAPKYLLPPAAVGRSNFSLADLSLEKGFTIQIGVGANGGALLAGGYAEAGFALGFSKSGITGNVYTSNAVIVGPQEGAAIGGVWSVAQGLPSSGQTKYYGATAFGGAGIGGNITTLTDVDGNMGTGRAFSSARLFVGEAFGAGAIRLMQKNYTIHQLTGGDR